MQCTDASTVDLSSAGRKDWNAHMEMGRLAFKNGFFKAASRNFRKAMSKVDDLNLGDELRACTLLRVAQCELKLGMLEDAESTFKEVLRFDQIHTGQHGYDVAIDMSELAMLYFKTGGLGQAESLLKEALRTLERLQAPTAPAHVEALKNLGIVQCREGHLDDAEKCLNRAICLCSDFGSDNQLYPKILAAMSALAAERGKLDEAGELIEKAIEKLEMATGGQHPDLADVLDLAANILSRNGRQSEVAALQERAEHIRQRMRKIDN
ncbi:MAG: tetratricopeptide repeat protein [Candidatus Obscuribacterales bacterium]|nr:tetratricopeptide repeat protein [Candidatus Obscuribacterales bacterium]